MLILVSHSEIIFVFDLQVDGVRRVGLSPGHRLQELLHLLEEIIGVVVLCHAPQYLIRIVMSPRDCYPPTDQSNSPQD
jgi:hypothetical protein